MKLKGQVAVVTGGGQGIGRGIALKLAQEGACVVLGDINLSTARNVAAEVEKIGQKSLAVRVDVTQPDQVDDLIAQTIKTFGQLNIMCNNAGVGSVQPFLEITEDEWNRVFAVNVNGVLFGIQSAAREMAKGQGGCIINTSSVAGRQGRPMLAAYAASKAAVINLTQSAAMALAHYKIRVNAVVPGVVETDMGRDVPALMKKYEIEGKVPPNQSNVPMNLLGRNAQPEDVARVVLFLASQDSEYMTGQSINVTGGRFMS
jgi:acetoin reductase-like protein